MFTLLLQDLYPSFRDFFNTDVVREYTAEGVYFGAKINRFNGIQFFSPRLDSFQNFFGAGLGNAAESSIPALQGEYYKLYYLVRYSWFYIAYFYLEGGYIGLSLNIAYLLSFLVVAYRIRNNISKNYLAYFVGMVLICLFTTGYFNALRLEIGYILYLFLSIPMAIAVDESRE